MLILAAWCCQMNVKPRQREIVGSIHLCVSKEKGTKRAIEFQRSNRWLMTFSCENDPPHILKVYQVQTKPKRPLVHFPWCFIAFYSLCSKSTLLLPLRKFRVICNVLQMFFLTYSPILLIHYTEILAYFLFQQMETLSYLMLNHLILENTEQLQCHLHLHCRSCCPIPICWLYPVFVDNQLTSSFKSDPYLVSAFTWYGYSW